MSDIQDYFEYIIKKHETVTDNSPVRKYVNNIENGITFKFKTGYYLELLMPKTMKSLESTKSKKTADENCQNVPHLEISEVVLVQCKIVNNDYQHNS